MIVIACSGPGAAEAIANAETYGWLLFGASAATTTFAVALRSALGTPWRSWGTALGLALLVLHPGLWWSARIGDCGSSRMFASLLGSTVIGLWLLVAVGAALVRRARARRAE